MKVVLFDFFGTLVRYEADRTVLRYPRTHDLLAGWGWERGHDEFVTMWDHASVGVERVGTEAGREVSMIEFAAAFDQHADVGLDGDQRAALAAIFVDEWSEGVRPVPGAHEMLRQLADHARLGIVSNTHDFEMVPRLVSEHFAPSFFEHTVLSVAHGVPKPDPSIYAAALAAFAVEASSVLFVGDSYEADYLGPVAAGMNALLIDPTGECPVPDEHRLSSVLDLSDRLRRSAGPA